MVSKKGAWLDGSTPTLLYGYGGFQSSSLPTYSGTIGKLWRERGGAYVLGNMRGGGEFGPEWHQTAMRENKQRTWDDFIAIGDKGGGVFQRHYLVAQAAVARLGLAAEFGVGFGHSASISFACLVCGCYTPVRALNSSIISSHVGSTSCKPFQNRLSTRRSNSPRLTPRCSTQVK